ncbi:hypothetical protein [Bythopirellula goksoeyrii]|uniref:Autotransporter-associated beta strand repeat protein n=1 Tax=Bythopirellula goksoeyrii TaxID=1400387 RepID=A0A5B9QSI5_9BACT|nr:hypothetical protein [Bythopirellula goksoeyrii]QEG36873.1 hypothetical protein Pr1d_42100 [Bythopirellula goksoeyrii]
MRTYITLIIAFLYTFCGGETVNLLAIDSAWLSAQDGNWTDSSQWSSTSYPENDTPSFGNRYDATINVVGNPYDVTLDQNVWIDRLSIDSSDAVLNIIDGGALTTTNGIHVENGSLVIDGDGVLYDTRISAGSEGVIKTGSNAQAYLNNVELAASLRSYNQIIIVNGMRLDEGILEFARGFIYAGSDILGSGEWQLKSSRPESSDFQYRILFHEQAGKELLIGPDVIVRSMGESVVLSLPAYFTESNSGTVVNQGQILAETDGGYFHISDFRNEGLIRITNGDYFSAGFKGAVGQVELQPGGEMTVYGSPHFDLSFTVGFDASLILNAETQATASQPLNLESGGTIYLRSPESILPIASTGGEVYLNFNSTGPAITATQLSTLPITGTAQVLLTSTYTGFDMESGVFDYSSLPSNYVFQPGYVFNGTLTGPQTPQDISQRLQGATLDVPLDLANGRVTLEGASTLAKPVQLSGGTLILTDDWTNLGGISVSAGLLELYTQGVSPGSIDMSGGTLRITYDTTLTDLFALSFGTPERLEIGDDPNGHVGGTLDLEGAVLDLNSLQSIDLAVTRLGEIQNGTIQSTHVGSPLFVHSQGRLSDVTLLDVKITGGQISNSTAHNLWATGSVNASQSTFINSRAEGNLSGNFSVEGQLEAHGLIAGTVHFLAGSTLTGTGTLGGGGGRFIRDQFTFVYPNVTLPSGINLVSSTRYDSNTVLDAPNTALVVNGNVLVGFETFQNSSWTDSWTFQVASLHTKGDTTVTEDGRLYVTGGPWTNSGEIQLTGGILDFEMLHVNSSGSIAGWGEIVGDLDIQGIINGTDQFQVTGDFVLGQTAIARLTMGESANLPPIDATGNVTLDGNLELLLTADFLTQPLVEGAQFPLISASNVIGQFNSISWDHPLIDLGLIYTPDAVILEVVDLPGAPGDFNFDDQIDQFDLGIWQNSYGIDAGGDADLDGDTDGRDFLIWQRNEVTLISPQSPLLGVPEPHSSILLVFGLALLAQIYRGHEIT